MDTKRLCIPEVEEIIDMYFPALDYGFVALKDYMGGDAAIEEAARVSYGQGTRTTGDTKNLIRYLFRNGHSSPFEMSELKFHIGLPIFVMRQLVRHRMASLNEYSGRYSIMPLMFYTPEGEHACSQSRKNKQGRAERIDNDLYLSFISVLEESRHKVGEYYERWLREDIARELSRIDLPLSTYTFCYWKIDLRNLFNVISLRSDAHAQWEIQQFSDIFAGIAQRLCPISFKAFEDYKLYSRTFSNSELMALRLLSVYHVSPIVWENIPKYIREEINVFLCGEGMSYTKSGGEGREMTEFWEKLRIMAKKDFSLSPDIAKPAIYYQNLIKRHAIEIPNA